jgi:hypothetical protein
MAQKLDASLHHQEAERFWRLVDLEHRPEVKALFQKIAEGHERIASRLAVAGADGLPTKSPAEGGEPRKVTPQARASA